MSLEGNLIRVSQNFPQAKVPWHCTCGSPQWSCSHSVHCFPPKPWWQWHWPVNYSGQAEKIINPPKSIVHRFILAWNIMMQVLPCCSGFPWSDLGYSHRDHTLSLDRSSSGSEHTDHSCDLRHSPYKDRLLSAHHSGNVHRCTLTGSSQISHMHSLNTYTHTRRVKTNSFLNQMCVCCFHSRLQSCAKAFP